MENIEGATRVQLELDFGGGPLREGRGRRTVRRRRPERLTPDLVAEARRISDVDRLEHMSPGRWCEACPRDTLTIVAPRYL
jgi:hypothetical protein